MASGPRAGQQRSKTCASLQKVLLDNIIVNNSSFAPYSHFHASPNFMPLAKQRSPFFLIETRAIFLKCKSACHFPAQILPPLPTPGWNPNSCERKLRKDLSILISYLFPSFHSLCTCSLETFLTSIVQKALCLTLYLVYLCLYFWIKNMILSVNSSCSGGQLSGYYLLSHSLFILEIY